MWGFPCSSVSEELACNAGDQGSIPGLGRSPGEGKGYPLQYSGLEDSMDRIGHAVVKSLPAMQETPVQVWVKKICWRRDRLPTPVFLGFPCGSAGKESACNVGVLGSILGLGRYPGEGKGYPLQYSGLENSMDRIVHGVTESQI